MMDWRDRQKSLEAKKRQIYATQNGFTQEQIHEHLAEFDEIQDAQKREVTKMQDSLFNSKMTVDQRSELVCNILRHEGFQLLTDAQQLLFQRKFNERHKEFGLPEILNADGAKP